MGNKLTARIIKSSEADKKAFGMFQVVEAAALLIMKKDRILAVYNEKWGAFTLPMSKVRPWEEIGGDPKKRNLSTGREAAVRSAAEWLGRTIVDPVVPLMICGEFLQGERDGQWKRYNVWVYKLAVADDVCPRQGAITEWLKADDFLDDKRDPISPTARHVIAELQIRGKL